MRDDPTMPVLSPQLYENKSYPETHNIEKIIANARPPGWELTPTCTWALGQLFFNTTIILG